MPRHPLERLNQHGHQQGNSEQTQLVQRDGVLYTEVGGPSQAERSSTYTDFARPQTDSTLSLRGGGGKRGKGKFKEAVQKVKDFVDPDEAKRREIGENLAKLRRDIQAITRDAGAFYDTTREEIDNFGNITRMDTTSYRERMQDLYSYHAMNNEFETYWGGLLDQGASLVELASAISAYRPKVNHLLEKDRHGKTEQAKQWENLQATLAGEQRPALQNALTYRVDELKATLAGLVGTIDTHYQSALSNIEAWMRTIPDASEYVAGELSAEAGRLQAIQYNQIARLTRDFESDYERQGKIRYRQSDIAVNFDLYSFHTMVGGHEEDVNNLNKAWQDLRDKTAQQLNPPRYEGYDDIYDA